MYIHTHTHRHLHTYIHTYMYICIYVYIYTYVIYIYTHTHTHTNAHTHTHRYTFHTSGFSQPHLRALRQAFQLHTHRYSCCSRWLEHSTGLERIEPIPRLRGRKRLKWALLRAELALAGGHMELKPNAHTRTHKDTLAWGAQPMEESYQLRLVSPATWRDLRPSYIISTSCMNLVWSRHRVAEACECKQLASGPWVHRES